MNEALILEKRDQLSAEVQSLESDVLQELKKGLIPREAGISIDHKLFPRARRSVSHRGADQR